MQNLYNLWHIVWQGFTQDWLLLGWVPIAMIIVYRGQRLKAALFIVTLSFVLRLQVDVMQSFGFVRGFTGFIDWDIGRRGLLVHSIFIALFLLLSYLSPNTKGPIYLAALLSLFFMSFFLSSIFMIV